MAFFKVSNSSEDVKEEVGGGAYINQSGMYEVEIVAGFVDKNDKGARSVSLLVDRDGTEQPLFSAFRLDNNDGSPNFEQQLFNKFLIVCGIDELDEPQEAVLPIGKGKSDKETHIFPEMEGIKVILRVAMEYGMWNGKVQERKKIKGVYNADSKATASEIVNGSTPGIQFEKDMAYANKSIYKDNLDEEIIKKWIDAGRPQNLDGIEGGGISNAPKEQPKFGSKTSKFGKK